MERGEAAELANRLYHFCIDQGGAFEPIAAMGHAVPDAGQRVVRIQEPGGVQDRIDRSTAAA